MNFSSLAFGDGDWGGALALSLFMLCLSHPPNSAILCCPSHSPALPRYSAPCEGGSREEKCGVFSAD